MSPTWKLLPPRSVLLTPLLIADERGDFVCIAKRDPDTQKIVQIALTSHDFAQQANICLADAQRIFQAAQVAASRLPREEGKLK